MTKFTDRLWDDLAREHGAALTQADRRGPGFARRPGFVAVGTLALAVGGTALALGLTTTGGTSAATGGTPAGTSAAASGTGGTGGTGGTRVVTDSYTITQSASGSVLVQINQSTSLPAANHKLTQMGIHEQVTIYDEPGAATVSGPVTCTPAAGVSGPALKVLLGTNGTEVIAPGTTGDNTGVGSWHLARCTVTNGTVTNGAGSGNTGVG